MLTYTTTLTITGANGNPLHTPKMQNTTLGAVLALAAAMQALPHHAFDSVANLKAHIKKVVNLVMENRSLDILLGRQTIAGLENPSTTAHSAIRTT
jgi:phospholipase C